MSAPDLGGKLALVTGDFATLQHATRAIEYARAGLAPGGTLVFVGLHPSRWIDFVFGAYRDGWFESADGAWLSSQRPLQFWQRHLQQLGMRGRRGIGARWRETLGEEEPSPAPPYRR